EVRGLRRGPPRHGRTHRPRLRRRRRASSPQGRSGRPRPVIEVEIDDEAWTSALPVAAGVVERAAAAALGAVAGDVVVLLSDDAAVQDLNARFRGKDRATNVLSFPAPQSAAPHLGDLVLAFGVCAA